MHQRNETRASWDEARRCTPEVENEKMFKMEDARMSTDRVAGWRLIRALPSLS